MWKKGSATDHCYEWREYCVLIGPICFHKSVCLPENLSKLAYMYNIECKPAQTSFQKLLFLTLLQYHPLE